MRSGLPSSFFGGGPGEQVRLIVLGARRVGKTTLSSQATMNVFPECYSASVLSPPTLLSTTVALGGDRGSVFVSIVDPCGEPNGCEVGECFTF